MSAMKDLLDDFDFEMVEEGLRDNGLSIDEVISTYHKAGGDKTYLMWCNIYGEELVNNWLNKHGNHNMTDYELYNQGAVIGLTEYFKWLKTLN